MTKMEKLIALQGVIDTATFEDSALREELTAFITKEIESLEKRAETAKARAVKKKAESDALTETIFGLVGENLVTVDTIVVEIGDEAVTRNKVIARLKKLVDQNLVVKEQIKTEGGSRKMAYRLASAVEGESAEDMEE